jgi:hypothetical protein
MTGKIYPLKLKEVIIYHLFQKEIIKNNGKAGGIF